MKNLPLLLVALAIATMFGMLQASISDIARSILELRQEILFLDESVEPVEPAEPKRYLA